MGLEHIALIIEADNRRMVMEDTWGHLAPVRNRTYKGRVVFAIGCYDHGELNPTPLLAELKGLDDSPWFYNALNEFLMDIVNNPLVEDPKWKAHARTGCVFEWSGTFRNYEFNGTVRLLLDANAQVELTGSRPKIMNATQDPAGSRLVPTSGSPRVDLGGGYTAVPFEAVTLNGMFLPQLVASAPGTAVAVIGPDNRALQGESGRTYRYSSIEEATDDVETLRRINSVLNEPASHKP